MLTRSLPWSTRHSDLSALLISAVAAAFAPLPTFLLAYIVLGPIHYLTEIQWLRKKGFYFTQGVIPSWMYGVAAGGLAVLGSLDYVLRRGFGNWIIPMLLIVSISATMQNRYALGAVVVAMVIVKRLSPELVFFVAIFTPSLVHVFVFTWFFMMSGGLRVKAKSMWRWLNPALLLTIPVLLLCLPVHYGPQGRLWLRLDHDSFEPLHQYCVNLLHHSFVAGPGMLNDPIAAGVLRVFAFIYLFHYLNWFGKADLLQWNRISTRAWTSIGVLYAGSLGLYAWDFRVGFLVTNYLGLLHVLLEFPLDWQAMRFVMLQRGRTAELAPVRDPAALPVHDPAAQPVHDRAAQRARDHAALPG